MNQVIMRPKKPPRPKSEVFLDREEGPRRKRLSAFGGDSPYGRLDAYIKLEQLGEGSYATVFKGFSNLTKQVRLDKSWGIRDLNQQPHCPDREKFKWRFVYNNNNNNNTVYRLWPSITITIKITLFAGCGPQGDSSSRGRRNSFHCN